MASDNSALILASNHDTRNSRYLDNVDKPELNHGSKPTEQSHSHREIQKDDTEASDPATGFSFSRQSRRKQLIFALLGVSNLAANTCFSLLPSFFPPEATVKGMAQTVTGLLFSCFEFVVFTSSPIWGRYDMALSEKMCPCDTSCLTVVWILSNQGTKKANHPEMPQIGPRFAFIAGQFMAGGCSVLFGTLNMSPPGTPFIVMCFLLRTFTGLGGAAFMTASFTLIANEFPDYVATVFGALEVFSGLGYVVGPLVGGALYDAGGFGMPFFVMGGLLVVCAVTEFFFMPARTDQEETQQTRSMLRLYASPLVVVSTFTAVCGTYSFGFMGPSLVLHLEQFHLSAMTTGALFMILAVLYALLSPVYGWLSEKKNITFQLLITGNTLVCISLLLMGPSPLLPFLSPELWLVVVGLILLGVGVGAAFIPTLKCFYIGARRLGFEDGLELDGLVSGLLNSAFHGGTFLGPTIGSTVQEATSFEWSATFNAGLDLAAVVCLVVYVIVEKTCHKHDNDEVLKASTNDMAFLQESSSRPEDTTDAAKLCDRKDEQV